MASIEHHLKEAAPQPPAGLTGALQALWWDERGEWERAHACVASDDGRDAAWVHAYLHRKEGDAGNAAYWYRQAGRHPAECSLDTEARDIGSALNLKASHEQPAQSA